MVEPSSGLELVSRCRRLITAMRDSELGVQFHTKIAIVLDQQLAGWQKANVTAFLISGIAATDPALVGEPYIDGSGNRNRYLPMCRQPIIVLTMVLVPWRLGRVAFRPTTS